MVIAVEPALFMKLPEAARIMSLPGPLLVIEEPAFRVMLPLVSKVTLSVKVLAPVTAMSPEVLFPKTMLLKPSLTLRPAPLNHELAKFKVPVAPVPIPMLAPAVFGCNVNVPVPVSEAFRLMLSALKVMLLPVAVSPELTVIALP